jgi:hypothetical protein
MKRLITLTVVFTAVFCTSCNKPDDDGKGSGTDTTGVTPPVTKYVIGSYYNQKGVEGIVYKVAADSLHGIIISLDESEKAWSDTNNMVLRYTFIGATSTDDGLKNTEKFKEKGVANFPAFAWCDAKNTGNINWYLPAFDELWEIATVCEQLQDSLSAHKGTKLSEAAIYWSSTELNNGAGSSYLYSLAVQFNVPPAQKQPMKGTSCKVRAVHTF